MATKTNAREQLITFVLDHGWELDPARKTWNNRDLRNYRDRELIQHPTAFRRPAHDGLFWSLELDYTVKSDYYKLDGTRLNRAILKLVNAEGELTQIGDKVRNLSVVEIDPKYADSWRTLNSLVWQVTYGPTGTATLRQRAEMVALDPALVVWLAVESGIVKEQQVAAARREREEQIKLRRRPLPITVDADTWAELRSELSRASFALSSADGLTDLPAAVARVEDAVAALRAVLKDTPADAVI